MLADLVVWINTHYLSLFLLMLAGFCFALAGLIWVFIVRRREVVLGEPDVPTVVEPADTTIHSPIQPQPNYHRSGEYPVVPRIPGAAPNLLPGLAAVARYLDTLDRQPQPIPGLREERIEQVPDEVIERVRAGLAGPTPSAPKTLSAALAQRYLPEHQPTQEIDLCPLTTQDIVIPAEGEAPFAEAVAEHRNRQRETQELSAHIAAIHDKERVA